MTKFTAAVLQMRSGVDPDANAKVMADMVEEAAGQGATYLQTPEMTGMVQRDRAGLNAKLKGEADDVIVRTASALAKQHGVFIHVGSVAVAVEGNMIANRAFLFGPDGKRITTYDKIHMFDVDLDNGESWRESAAYTPGATAKLVSLPFGKLGCAICYDVRFPELFRVLRTGGADVLALVSAWVSGPGKEEHWLTLLRARAIENTAYVVAASQPGPRYSGHSMVVDPLGDVLVEAGEAAAVVRAELRHDVLVEVRRTNPSLHNRRL